jgi:hypothetical protein
MSFNAAATSSGVSRRQTSGLAAGTLVVVRALVNYSGESAARVRLNHIGAVNPATPASVEAFRNLRREYGVFIGGGFVFYFSSSAPAMACW